MASDIIERWKAS